MNDFEFLYLVLVLIYLSECFFWVRRGSLVLRGSSKGDYSFQHPSISIGNEGGGTVFLGIFPPAGGAFRCRFIPYSLTPDTAVALPPQSLDPGLIAPNSPALFRFNAVKSIRAGDNQVWVDDAIFLRDPDDRTARANVDHLKEIKSQKPARRDAAIDELLAKMTDTAAITEKVNEYERRSRFLRVGCHLMFASLVVIPAVAVIRPEIVMYWPKFLVMIAACDVWIAVCFYLAHRRLLPDAVMARWKGLAIMFLTPTAAIRACHTLSRDLLLEYDPLASAAVLCGPETFAALARRVLSDLSHTHVQSPPNDAREIRDAFAKRMGKVMEALVVNSQLTVADVLKPPTPLDATCVAYCPRCDTQFSGGTGVCQDCGGVALISLAPLSPDAEAVDQPAESNTPCNNSAGES